MKTDVLKLNKDCLAYHGLVWLNTKITIKLHMKFQETQNY